MIDNEWEMTAYPLVPGHEVVGTVAAVGEGVTNVAIGDTIGLGWYSGSCLTCRQCMSGDHNLCADNEATIVGRHGGFADTVRCRPPFLFRPSVSSPARRACRAPPSARRPPPP